MPHLAQPGDTWAALAWRYSLSEADLATANQHLNRQRQPAIGATVSLPATGAIRNGRLVRTGDGGLLQTAARYGLNPWSISGAGLAHPYRPLFYQPLFLPGGDQPPRDLPAGFTSLELSRVPALPGQALAFRAQTTGGGVSAQLNQLPANTFQNGRYLVGLLATGAFFGAGEPELSITVEGLPLWSQPWRFDDDQWVYQQITLTGAAAAIDADSIARERERLFAIWSQATPQPQWTRPFSLPISSYLEMTSPYGARRSYNGGPYRSYHEGVDFSAYGGTPVTAPAAGTVVVAEFLFVRGGAVILDHGLGIYSGYYHMSSVAVEPGQVVQPGQILGEVGTTGLSTGNHLHWDLLVGATWVDAAAWLEQDLACWILAGLGERCED